MSHRVPHHDGQSGSAALLRTENLTVRFGGLAALNGVDFAFLPNSLVPLLVLVRCLKQTNYAARTAPRRLDKRRARMR